jgi:hypothetical protein
MMIHFWLPGWLKGVLRGTARPWITRKSHIEVGIALSRAAASIRGGSEAPTISVCVLAE